jgi:hypothetical protein
MMVPTTGFDTVATATATLESARPLTASQRIARWVRRDGWPTREGGHDPAKEAAVVPVPDASCAACGGSTGGLGQPRASYLKGSFMDRNAFRVQHSASLCSACVLLMDDRHARTTILLESDAGLRALDRQALRDALAEPPEPPFVLVVPTSLKKHLIFRATVAGDRDHFPVQYEEVPAWVDRATFVPVLLLVEEMRAVFSGDEILSGRYQQHRIQAFGLARWRASEAVVAAHRASPSFPLLVMAARRPLDEEQGSSTAPSNDGAGEE